MKHEERHPNNTNFKTKYIQSISLESQWSLRTFHCSYLGKHPIPESTREFNINSTLHKINSHLITCCRTKKGSAQHNF